MARYRKVDVRIWSDREFRRLSRPQPNGQSLWFYLLTGRETAIIPGVFAAREAGLAEELRWPLEGFRKAFAEVSGEAFASGLQHGAEKPLAKADWDAGFVWVPNAIKHNKPQSPNVIRSWREAWDELPECDIKAEAYQWLRGFVKAMGEGFLEAFDEVIPKPSWKPFAKPLANQDQEQEQEQDQEQERERAPANDAVPGSLEFALREAKPSLIGSGAVAEATAVHLAELGLKRVDSAYHRVDLVWIAEQPADEVVRVAATVLADTWCKGHMGRASTPRHLRSKWHEYAEGPKPESQRGMSAVSSRAEIEADAAAEPEPEWMHDA